MVVVGDVPVDAAEQLEVVLVGSFDMDIAQKFAAMNIYTREKCRDCWAKFYCSGGCSAANHNFSKDLNVPYEMGCKMEQKRLECAIYLKAAEAITEDL